MRLRSVAALALLALAPATHCLTPAQESLTHELLFYALKGNLDTGKLAAVLEAIPATLERGPETSSARPSYHFIALRVAADTPDKSVTRALKKSRCKVELLEWIRFRGRSGDESQMPIVLELGPRDHIIGSHGDIRWYESGDDWAQCYVTPGKLAAEGLQSRYKRLFEPFGGATLGEVERASIDGRLDPPLAARSVKKLKKELAKLQGVTEVRVGPEGATLSVSFEMYRLERSAAPSGPAVESGPLGGFSLSPVLAALKSHAVECSWTVPE